MKEDNKRKNVEDSKRSTTTTTPQPVVEKEIQKKQKTSTSNSTSSTTTPNKQQQQQQQNSNTSTGTKKSFEIDYIKQLKGLQQEGDQQQDVKVLTLDSKELHLQISSLTLGDLMASLQKGNYRIDVAEYILNEKISGLVDKYQFLLEWAFNVLSASYKRTSSNTNIAHSNVTPYCFELRIWKILEQVLVKKEFSANEESTNSIFLAKDHLSFMLDIVANIHRHFTVSTDSNPSTIPPLPIVQHILNILPRSIQLHHVPDFHRELVIFIEKFVPSISQLFQSNNNSLLVGGGGGGGDTAAAKSGSSSPMVQVMHQVFKIVFVVLDHFLQMIKRGRNSRPLYNIVISILPHLITYQHFLQSYLERLYTSSLTTKINNAVDESGAGKKENDNIISSLESNIEMVDSILKWSCFHPDSRWETLLTLTKQQGNDKEKEKEKEKDKKSSTKGKEKEKEKDEKKEVVGAEGGEKKDNNNLQILFDKLESILNAKEVVKGFPLDGGKIDPKHIVLEWISRLLSLFVSQYKSVGKSQINNQLLSECKVSIEFGFFKSLYTLIINNNNSNQSQSQVATTTKTTKKSSSSSSSSSTSSIKILEPIYYLSISKLIDNVSSINIVHHDNPQEFDFLLDHVKLTIQTLASSETSQQRSQSNGLYLMLSSYLKLSHKLLESNFEKIIGLIISQSIPTENSIILMNTFLDTYLSIRQSDVLFKAINNQIINGRLKTISVSLFKNPTFIARLSHHVSNIPFGLIPNLFESMSLVYSDYFITQLSELYNNNNSSQDNNDMMMMDPIICDRLECFQILFCVLYDHVDMSNFVIQNLQKFLPNHYTTIVTPIVQLMGALLEIHSFVNRQVIVKEGEGQNDYHFHPQQFHYYQLYEKQFQSSNIMKLIIQLLDQDKLQLSGDKNNNNNNNLSIYKLFISRIQQLNSLLSSEAHGIEKDKKDATSAGLNIELSSLENSTPSAIRKELNGLVNHILQQYIEMVENKKKQESSLEMEGLNQLILDNICVWCDYALPNHILDILSFILSPNNNHINSNNGINKPTTFNLVLTNSQFYEIESFRQLLPLSLAIEIQKRIPSSSSSKDGKYSLLSNLIDQYKDELNNNNNNNNNNKSLEKSIKQVSDLILSSKEKKDSKIKCLEKESLQQLTWLMSIIPAINPLYFDHSSITFLILIIFITLSIIQQEKGESNNNNNNNNTILATLKLIKHCLNLNSRQLTQQIPIKLWQSIQMEHCNNNDIKQVVMDIQVIVCNELLHLGASGSQQQYTTLLESINHSINQLEKTKNMQELIVFLRSLTVEEQDSGYTTLPSLSSILDGKQYNQLDTTYHQYLNDITKQLKEKSSKLESRSNVDEIQQFFDKNNDKLSLILYYMWYLKQDNNNSNNNEIVESNYLSLIIKYSSPLIVKIYNSSKDNNNNNNNLQQQSTSHIESLIIMTISLFTSKYLNTLLEKQEEGEGQEGLYNLSYLLSIIVVYLQSMYPQQSKQSILISNSILQIYHFNNNNNNYNYIQSSSSSSSSQIQLIPSLINLWKTDKRLSTQLSIIQIINLLLNTDVLITSSTLVQISQSILSSIQYIANHQFDIRKYIFNNLKLKKDINNNNNGQDCSDQDFKTINQITTMSLNILSKLIENTKESNKEKDQMDYTPSSSSTTSTASHNLILYEMAILAIMTFNPPFIYKKMLPMKQQQHQTTDNNVKNNMEIDMSPMFEITPTDYTHWMPLTNSTFLGLCRLLSSITRSLINSGNHSLLQTHIPIIINCSRYLIYGLGDEENKLSEHCTRNLSRLLDMLGRMKDIKEYAHYLVLDYINILTFVPTTSTSSSSSSSSSSSKQLQQHLQTLSTLENYQQLAPSVWAVTRYYYSLETRRILQPGLSSLFGIIEDSMRNVVFSSLGDIAKPHFKVLYESFKNEKQYSVLAHTDPVTMAINEYQVVGRHVPTERDPQPKLYRMRLFAKTEVHAKSRFWYFLSKIQKMKKTTGQIINITQIFEKKPTTIKNYGVFIRYNSRSGTHNIYKEYRDTSRCGAIAQMYDEMASRHSAREKSIHIIEIKQIAAAQCKRANTKQFHDAAIKFPLAHRVPRLLPKEHK
ncbi:hypothetical protein DFA_09450 [Cavenderia fasciculata]|uniref:Uncharacterized protein n=1 Tax=Cavenderia fasciculata TaxID=261658 RepID=F4Q7N3_CACFS|nr:uncharacterized protein DFA_09450 [Cavenderia fasciculata]EGG16415.1 hypothetical protein DFA_09450 [Cavenderia fasciculata]|eukprot:XP_004354799.1 hypothetical protein DFA_09450 [Cavenderia fasciculata]